jgi:hypothetical protein
MLSGAFSFHQAKGEKSTKAKPPKVIVREATSRAGRVTIHQPLPQIATPFGLRLVHLCSSRGPIVPRLRHQRKVTQPRHGPHAAHRHRAGGGSGAPRSTSRRAACQGGRDRVRPGIRRPTAPNAPAPPHGRPNAAASGPHVASLPPRQPAAVRQTQASGSRHTPSERAAARRRRQPRAPAATRSRWARRAGRASTSRGGPPALAAPGGPISSVDVGHAVESPSTDQRCHDSSVSEMFVKRNLSSKLICRKRWL